MNEKPESPESGEAGDNGPDNDSALPAARDASGESAREPAGTRNAVWAIAALVVALASLGLSGWQWWQARESGAAETLVEQQRTQSGRVERLAGELERLAGRVDGLDGRLEERVGGLDGTRDELEALVDRVDGLEGGLDERAGGFDAARDELQSISERVGRLDERLDEQAGRLQTVREQLSGADERLAPLRAADDRLGERLDALAAQLDGVEESVSSRLSERDDRRARELVDEARRAESRLGLIEIAGLLRLGQSQAELAGDLGAARAAYARAERRLDELDDDRLERLASLLGREREALEDVDEPDWSSAAQRLEALSDKVGDWPREQSDRAPESSDAAEPSTDDGGWMQGMRRSLGQLVRISPREQAPLTPAAMESVRERVRLHLVAAQAAAARRNLDELARHARSAGELARAHFDAGAAPVERALDAFAQIESMPALQLPALGEALAEVNRRLADS